MNIPLHLGKYYRYLFKEAKLLVVIGYFEEVLTSKALYEERYGVPPLEGERGRTLDRIMAAAALSAVSLSERESWGWSLTLPGSEDGFFCGVEPEGMVCGTARAAHPDKNAAYVQRQKGDAPMTQSYYEPNTDDPVTAVEAYFTQSVQIETRIALGENHIGVLVQCMPEGRFDEVAGLEDEKLIAMLTQMAERGELEPVGEVVMFYECRCSDDLILGTVTGLPKERQKELWGDDTEITAECPRCGRAFTVQRAAVPTA